MKTHWGGKQNFGQDHEYEYSRNLLAFRYSLSTSETRTGISQRYFGENRKEGSKQRTRTRGVESSEGGSVTSSKKENISSVEFDSNK